jgi:L-alanine-DL-glutamate epimerase-like enolase superfamily enzyme
MKPSMIMRVQAKVVCLPLQIPVAIATRMVTERHWLFVKVTTADGVEGLGFSFVGYENGTIAEQVIQRFLTPIVEGKEAISPSEIWVDMVNATRFFGTDGLIMRCISAVDIALWDRNAKAQKLPLFRMFSEHPARELPVYVGAGYYPSSEATFIGANDVYEVEEIRQLKLAGFSAVKVKVGRLPAFDEALRVRSFRDALGPTIELIVDVNGAWKNLASAKPFLRLLDDIGVSTVEDPFPVNQLKDYADLRRGARIKVSSGELYGSPQQFYTAFDFSAIDVPQIDATVCGGVTAFLALAKFYEAKKITFETHWFPDLHIHLTQVSSLAARIEIFANDETINFGQLITSKSRLAAGGSLPSLDFGHGVQLKNKNMFIY